MNKKTILIILGVSVILLLFIRNILNNNDKNLNDTHNKDSNYYLTSPWVTERAGWFFITLPEKWNEDNTEIEKSKANYDEISNEAHMYELKLKNFYLTCMYMDAKEGIYQNWDLDKSANAMINQVFYNLKCKDIALKKLPPYNNPLEVNYSAISDCVPHNFKAISKGIRFNSHILFVCTYFKESDSTLEIIAERIINSIENKYPEVSNVK